MRGFSVVCGVAFSCLVASHAHAQRALGLDVSAWQTEITTAEWATLHRPANQQVGGVFGDGRDFVFIRSSRGGTTGYYDQSNADNNPPTNTFSQRYDDPYFIQNITRATQAGMFAGPYHFSRPDIIESTLNSGGIANSGADEADHFMQMAGPWMRPGYLIPMHDLEAGDQIRSDPEIAEFTLDFSDRMYEVMGIRPGIYVNGNYARYVLGGATAAQRAELLEKHPNLWIARWPNQSNPNAIDPHNELPDDSLSWLYGIWDDTYNNQNHQPWHFWQYASTMRLNGNNNKGSNTDVNVANGGIEYLKDHLVPALWMSNSSGDWNTLASWNSGQTPVAPVQARSQVPRVGPMTLPNPRLPGHDDAANGVQGENDTVILDRPSANITVTHSSGTHNIRKLYVNETLNITGGSLNVGYVPAADSTPISAQFSGAVTLSGGSFSVHTLEVDASRVLTLAGGNLTVNKINLMRQSTTPAKIFVEGDVNISPLANAAAVIGNGGTSGNTALVDLRGADRELNIGNGSADVDLTISVPVTNGSLTKSGAGTLALTGANTYAGDTTVEAGRLRLNSGTLANGADVYLSTGATLDLSFSSGTPDIIDSLLIDGISQQAGIWGAIGSGAEFTSPLLSGVGRLQVTTYVAPIAGDFNGDGVVSDADLPAWQAGYGMETGAVAGDGDADGDGAVDGRDLLAWQRSLGMSSVQAPATAAIPEPAAATLLLLSAAGLFTLASRRPTR
ncbi:MAG TPA: GH25 family lysozyme [Lacipirellula sp.]